MNMLHIYIYSTYRKDRRYSTNISYRSCHFGGPKSTNHIEDNACCKSCPKQVFGGFQPHFLGIIFYMVCKWQLPFNINNSLVFTVFLAILTKLSVLLPRNCMYAQMPVCCQSTSTLAGFGGELLQQGLLEPSLSFFCVFFGADVKVIPRKKADHIEDNGVPSWFIDGSIVQSNRRYSQNQFCQFFYTQNIHQRISSIWSVNPWSCKYFLPQSLNLRLGNTVLTLFPQAWCMQVNLQDWKGLALLLVHMCPIVSKLYIWLIIFYLVGKITFFQCTSPMQNILTLSSIWSVKVDVFFLVDYSDGVPLWTNHVLPYFIYG